MTHTSKETSVIQREVDQLLTQAEQAAQPFSRYTTYAVEKIIQALVKAAVEHAEHYANWSVEETGYGNIEDNLYKYRDYPPKLLERYQPADYIEPSADVDNNIVSFPKPAGIIAALVPATNPIMTIYYEAIIAMMTRNVLIFSPHPKAQHCAQHAIALMCRTAEDAGAPTGVIQSLPRPGIEALDYLLASPRVNLILATGGKNRVAAACRSGNPVFGMGPGNVPCFVHRSATLAAAAEHIIASNSFDHGLPCVCESVVIADSAIAQPLRGLLAAAGGYFVTGAAAEQLRAWLFPEGRVNPAVIGKSAVCIAAGAGIAVPPDTKSLLLHVRAMDDCMCREKSFPVMGYIEAEQVPTAIEIALAILETGGKGHSAVIHGTDETVIHRYAAALPVCRIAVNTRGVDGSSGVSTHLTRGPLIGTGFFGGSCVDDNIGPHYLVQQCRVAYPADATLPDRDKH